MKKQWNRVIGIALFCILALIVSFATYIGIRGYAVNSGVVVASQFLDTLRNHDYAAAHMLMAPSKQSAVSVSALQKAQEQIEKNTVSGFRPRYALRIQVPRSMIFGICTR